MDLSKAYELKNNYNAQLVQYLDGLNQWDTHVREYSQSVVDQIEGELAKFNLSGEIHVSLNYIESVNPKLWIYLSCGVNIIVEVIRKDEVSIYIRCAAYHTSFEEFTSVYSNAINFVNELKTWDMVSFLDCGSKASFITVERPEFASTYRQICEEYRKAAIASGEYFPYEWTWWEDGGREDVMLRVVGETESQYKVELLGKNDTAPVSKRIKKTNLEDTLDRRALSRDLAIYYDVVNVK